MTTPILFHDPTSEPSRAVHWLTVAAGIPVDVRYTWLTRDDHLTEGFLEVNPCHQVPALQHGEFCLAEASAIMIYLVELHGGQDDWIGSTAIDRARTYRFLSWHQSNTRLRVTIDYFLPVLLMPAYHGGEPPPPQHAERLRSLGRTSLATLDDFLSSTGRFLGGAHPSIADLFVASDLFALDLDPGRRQWFDGFHAVTAWLETLRSTAGYEESHRPWNAIVPVLHELLLAGPDPNRDNHWVAEECKRHLGHD